jgi:hypothetical protein
MDDAVNIWVLRENPVECFLISDIDTYKLWSLSADEFNAIDNLLGGVVKIVNDYDFVASFKEGKGGEGANVAAASERVC